MPWRVVLSPRAEKDLEALPPLDRSAVLRALARLAVDPGSVDLAKLAGQGGRWRLRVGRWRAILRLDNASGEITVSTIRPRSRAYRECRRLPLGDDARWRAV